MGVGKEVAVIVAKRRGKNWIVHTRGIDVKHVLQTSQDVANHLDRVHEASSGRSGPQGKSSYGQVQLDGTSFTAVYRVVNQVVVMTLSQDDGNIFNSINLLSTIARLLLLELRGGDAALEKVSVKKMAQIYLAVDAMMLKGYTELGPPVSDALSLIDGSQRLRGLKSPKDAPPVSMTAPAPLGSKRKLSRQSAMLEKFSFTAPQEVQDLPAPPQPSSFVSDPLSMMPLDGMGGAAAAVGVDPNDPFASSSMFSASAEASAAANDPFLSSSMPQGQAADMFALDGLAAGMQGPQGALQALDGFEASPWDPRQSDSGGLAASVRRISTAGQGGIQPQPNGGLLPAAPPTAALLVKEVWHGEVEGSVLRRAGTTGGVQWASEDVRSLSPSIAFTLLVPDFPDSLLRQALQCARLHRTAASPGPTPRTFVAQSAAATSASTPMLQYQLPACFCKPPISVQAGFTCTEAASGSCLLLIGLQYALNPNLGLPVQGMVVDMVLPPSVASPQKMDPPAQWSPSQSAARFTLPRILPGQTGSISALFLAPLGPQAAYKALKDVRITAKLLGAPGSNLSGTALCQGSLSQPFTPTAEACCWEAHVTASLLVPDSPYIT